MIKHWIAGVLAFGMSGSVLAEPLATSAAGIPIGAATVCADDVCEPVCGPMYWASADYLLWWSKRGPRPGPIAVTGSVTDLFPGALDQPGTRVLSGNEDISYGSINGIRLRAGMWLDRGQSVGVELSGLLLEQVANGSTYAGDANGQPFIGRPFTNVLTGNPNVYFVSQNLPNPALTANMTGQFDILAQSRFWTWEANALVTLSRSASSALVGVVGFKSAALDERFLMDEIIRNLAPGGGSTFNGTPTTVNQRVKIVDDFRTNNRFYGGQVGGRYTSDMGELVFDLSAMCALGVNRQETTIIGGTALYNGNTQIGALPGGVLALPSNMGTYKRDVFAVIPEASANVGYRLTSWLTARVGYSFLYWNNVARPTQRLDTVVNPNLVPSDGAFGTPGGAGRPSFAWAKSDYWLHGVNFGIDIRW